jgi:hypothetical protein
MAVEEIPTIEVKEENQEVKPAAGGFSIGGDESDEEAETLDN